MTRNQMIACLEKKGRFYRWKRFSDSQIFNMYNKYVLSNLTAR